MENIKKSELYLDEKYPEEKSYGLPTLLVVKTFDTTRECPICHGQRFIQMADTHVPCTACESTGRRPFFLPIKYLPDLGKYTILPDTELPEGWRNQ